MVGFLVFLCRLGKEKHQTNENIIGWQQ